MTRIAATWERPVRKILPRSLLGRSLLIILIPLLVVQAVALLMPYQNVTVFYGHIHQERHHMTGHIGHHSAKSLIFALPAPGSQPKRTPQAWDATHPYAGLGFREIETVPQSDPHGDPFAITEFPVTTG